MSGEKKHYRQVGTAADFERKYKLDLLYQLILNIPKQD